MDGDFFKYLSIAEGLMICAMLGWEVFWLRRMYQVLQSMPTAKQLQSMIDGIKKDRDAVKSTLENIANMFESAKKALGGLLPMKFPSLD